MANYLWKVTTKRDKMEVKKGMSVEVITQGGKPQLREIVEALNRKYNIGITISYFSSNSEFELETLD
jgi:hypothetical protein